MYSYPNLIPLNSPAVRRIVQSIEPFAYDRLFSAWFDRTLSSDARAAVRSSLQAIFKPSPADAVDVRSRRSEVRERLRPFRLPTSDL